MTLFYIWKKIIASKITHMRSPWTELCISKCLAFISANYNTFTCWFDHITEYVSESSSECSPTQEATSVPHSLYNCKLAQRHRGALQGAVASGCPGGLRLAGDSAESVCLRADRYLHHVEDLGGETPWSRARQ